MSATQPDDLFSFLERGQAAQAAAEEAIRRVRDHADPGWLTAAERIVLALPAGATFTTDYIWDRIASPAEPRALGAVMRKLARARQVEQTGSYQRSIRKECHARTVPVWRRL